MKKCKIKGCSAIRYSRGYCAQHYALLPTCVDPECVRKQSIKGYCREHHIIRTRPKKERLQKPLMAKHRHMRERCRARHCDANMDTNNGQYLCPKHYSILVGYCRQQCIPLPNPGETP